MQGCVRLASLPLTVYREIAAHLRQVEGVHIELVSQQAQQFNYDLSQIDSMWIEYSDNSGSEIGEQVQQILAYYSDRYGDWETVQPLQEKTPNSL